MSRRKRNSSSAFGDFSAGIRGAVKSGIKGAIAETGYYLGSGAGVAAVGPTANPLGIAAAAGAGGYMGRYVGNGISRVLGMGDYSVKANSLLAKVDMGVQVPRFGDARHATVVRHREYIQDITVPAAPTTFTNTSFSVNPGLNGSFPWLSGVAENYDQYQVLGMIFEYRTLSSDITAGGALGSVIMASDYDVADTSYSSKLEMENSEYCTSAKPSESFSHAIECDPGVTFSPIKFVRNGAVPADKDNRLYDHTNFQIATVGLPGSAGTVLGELWVTYEIALYKPTIEASNLAVAHINITGPSTSHYLGPDTTTVQRPQTGSTLDVACVNSTFYFPPGLSSGIFEIVFAYYGTSASVTGLTIGTLSNCATYANMGANGAAVSSMAMPAGAITSVTSLMVLSMKIVGPNATFVVSGGVIPTSGWCDIWVTQLPGDLIA
nr:MAG: putative capsid protein [Arizlama virus]